MSRPFPAQYPGHCAADDCPAPAIAYDDLIRFDALSRTVHATCPPEPPAPKVCPGCNMALPATGRCDDCD